MQSGFRYTLHGRHPQLDWGSMEACKCSIYIIKGDSSAPCVPETQLE